jgi:hypothetical protein
MRSDVNEYLAARKDEVDRELSRPTRGDFCRISRGSSAKGSPDPGARFLPGLSSMNNASGDSIDITASADEAPVP